MALKTKDLLYLFLLIVPISFGIYLFFTSLNFIGDCKADFSGNCVTGLIVLIAAVFLIVGSIALISEKYG